ncbi:hypothetical protein [Humisphaera borealis]|uniref:Uncharacterized protein n=1 Tax=Humisphaera borealis TaxID=2807512 RepID=A0A7M2WZK4_9BACT|nr:hypothetical protein [Humisphaera borealis]QOV90947.1 hypothetical protein IPV69_06185 [Humisphaera borealis]
MLEDLPVATVGSGYGWVILRRDGTVVGVPPSPELRDATAIAAGSNHVLALRKNGTVVAWGYMDGREIPATVPPGLRDVVAIAAGDSHSVALRKDGSVYEWGIDRVARDERSRREWQEASDRRDRREAEQLGLPWLMPATRPNPAPLPDAGIVMPGIQRRGIGRPATRPKQALPLPDVGIVELPVPTGLKDVVAIAAGNDYTLALRKDGTVIGWGDHAYGKLAIPLGLRDVVAIAAGPEYALAMRRDGTVVGWGRNQHGQYPEPPENIDIRPPTSRPAEPAEPPRLKGTFVFVLSAGLSMVNDFDSARDHVLWKVDGLHESASVNVVLYQDNKARPLFPKPVPASAANKQRIEELLREAAPLGVSGAGEGLKAADGQGASEVYWVTNGKASDPVMMTDALRALATKAKVHVIILRGPSYDTELFRTYRAVAEKGGGSYKEIDDGTNPRFP